MTSVELNNLSNYAQWLGSFVIVLFAFSKYNSFTKEIKILGILGVVSVICQAMQEISEMFLGNKWINNIGDFYLYIETILLLLLYYSVFRRRLLKVFLIMALVICSIIYGFLFVYVNNTWYGILGSTQSILLIFCSVAFFFQLINNLPEVNLTRMPMFWINTAILSYFSCIFLFSLSVNYIIKELISDFTYYWAFQNFLRVGFCVLVLVGIWKARKLLNTSLEKTL